MRDKSFVAAHRGGLLSLEDHKILIRWARLCAAHVLPLITEEIDERLKNALKVAEDWENGKVKTGVPMKASVSAHALARETQNEITKTVARAIGHAVATAHMADHSLGGALYALKAVKLAGKSVEAERKWQMEQLQNFPVELKELVLQTQMIKEKSFKL